MRKTFDRNNPALAEKVIRAGLKNKTVREIETETSLPKSTVARYIRRILAVTQFLPRDPDVVASEILGVEQMVRFPPSVLTTLEYEANRRNLSTRHLVEKIICIVCAENMVQAVLDD